MPEELSEAHEPEPVQDAPRRLVLVAGAGRSGTSTIAGALYYLGLHVPLPVLGANESNPRGFFESKWPLDFHKRILARAFVDPFDARPEALGKMTGSVSDDDRRQLREWLADQAQNAPQLAVKDPRSSWVTGTWAETADELGLGIGYVSMLRHPAEVIGSRSKYYGSGHDEEWVRRYQVVKLAGWINTSLLVERQTRGERRAFVRYDDLLDDWRSVLSRLQEDLGLEFNTDVRSGAAHQVDEFIDPGLRRVRVTWDDLDVPASLSELAEEVWNVCGDLAAEHGSDEKAQTRLDDVATRYASLYKDAQAIAHDTVAAERKEARQKAERATRAKMKKKLAQATADRPEPKSRLDTFDRIVGAVRSRVGRG